METQNVEPKAAKRYRKRKKQKLKEICQQMEFYFSDANLSKDRFLNQLIAKDPSKDNYEHPPSHRMITHLRF